MDRNSYGCWSFVFKLSLGFALALVIGIVSAEDIRAQSVGVCASGESEAYLDVGNVRARLMNTGGLFWNGAPHVYEVPKGSGVDAIFSASLWLGGRVNDSLRIATTRYGQHEFWPGPIVSIDQPPLDCTPYDRLAVLYRDDVEQYDKNGLISTRLAQWPWQWGAPVIDGDGDPNNYNLASGDRPELLGDQMVWWVMNDVGNEHKQSLGLPMGMEVHVTAFAFNTAGAVGNATFYRYRLRYKGTAPLDSAYVGFFFDPDLGDFDDDYVGTDTTLGMAYVYNADNFDEDHYGEAPPALGVSFLQGPLALRDAKDNDREGNVDEVDERLRATSVRVEGNSSILTARQDQGPEFYRYMQGLWSDGEPMTEGGGGRNYSGQVTTFVFPGDPVTGAFWSERNAQDGYANTPADRRFIIASGPFAMEPGSEEEILIGIAWSRGDSNLDSVRKLREDMAFIQSITSELMTPRLISAKATSPEPFALGYHHAYPNPLTTSTTIRYSLEHPDHTHLAVYDMLGREVAVLVDEPKDIGWHEAVFDARTVAAGGYVYRLQVGQQVATETMVVQ